MTWLIGSKTVGIALAGALAGTMVIASLEPADARTNRSKASKQQQAKVARSPSRGVQRDGWEAFPGYPGHRDRTTFYHPNGRLNGKELFDSIADRAGSAGE